MINLSLSDYEPRAYDALPEFFVARGGVGAAQKRANEFGSVICKYHYEDVVGLTLLHQHFPISHSEILVRYVRPDGATMRPEPRSNFDDKSLVPYLWMYCEIDGDVRWYPVEYVQVNEYPVAEVELLRYADPLLEELGTALLSADMHKTFGIASMNGRRGIRLEDSETLLESTDEINKVLELAVVGQGTFDESETTQTFWTFVLDETAA